MINVLIVDDQKQACEALSSCLKQVVKDELIINLRTNIQETMAEIELEKLKPDVIFMDIQLNETNGITMAAEIRDNIPSCQIVFISGYDDYYLDVYDVDHVFFLRKPFQTENVLKSWEKVKEKLMQDKSQYFHYKKNGTNHRIPMRDIIYFEMQARKVVIHTTEGNDVFYGTAEEIMKQTSENILRCHKGFLVNIQRFKKLNAQEIIMDNDDSIPLGKTYKNGIMDAYATMVMA